MTRWLIVGHGSVGSALTRRIAQAGLRATVYDPAPRVAVVDADHITRVVGSGPKYDRVVSCVSPSSARQLITDLGPVLTQDTIYYDWNTLTPAAKVRLSSGAPFTVIDVALLDTLDDEAEEVSLAVSGNHASRAVSDLTGLGFRVTVVGDLAGQAAELKLVRSLFMKTLEALLLEFHTTLYPVAGREVVMESIERNLGSRFTEFGDTLIKTDRLHASRRAAELMKAVETRNESGATRLARTAVEVLLEAAAAWRKPDAPDAAADLDTLVHYLARTGALEWGLPTPPGWSGSYE